jgi:hypothetical protein
MLFFKKRIKAEQGTQKTPKTGKRKSKNDHASAVRVQKLLNRPFFTRGQTLDNPVHKYKVLPIPSTFKPRVILWKYLELVSAFPSPRLGNTRSSFNSPCNLHPFPLPNTGGVLQENSFRAIFSRAGGGSFLG